MQWSKGGGQGGVFGGMGVHRTWSPTYCSHVPAKTSTEIGGHVIRCSKGGNQRRDVSGGGRGGSKGLDPILVHTSHNERLQPMTPMTI